MNEPVRVVEYSFATPEQRRTMAESLGEEMGKGATVVGMVPVSLMTDGEEGDLVTLRVAVYLLGGEASGPGGPMEEAAAVGVAEEEMAAPSLVDEIMHIHEPGEDAR